MTLDKLENLVKIGQLKHEAFDPAEYNGLLTAAANRLHDAKLKGLSQDGQFTLAYGAAHALALAALRQLGYRSESRYMVFQCLQYTAGLEAIKWRVLDKCHHKRNVAEYEGHLEIDEQLLKELIAIAQELSVKIT